MEPIIFGNEMLHMTWSWQKAWVGVFNVIVPANYSVINSVVFHIWVKGQSNAVVEQLFWYFITHFVLLVVDPIPPRRILGYPQLFKLLQSWDSYVKIVQFLGLVLRLKIKLFLKNFLTKPHLLNLINKWILYNKTKIDMQTIINKIIN